MTAVASSEQPERDSYTFQSKPETIKRAKYRFQLDENEDPLPYQNIMFDRRVIRGNTYSQAIIPINAQPDPIEIQKKNAARRKALAKQRAREQLRTKSPDPVEGRFHAQIQTEMYLEELTNLIEEKDVKTQTEPFLDRAPTPLFVPAKSGKDVATQIYEGDLFYFDEEVKPVIDVLVGKILEQSLLEAFEEEELLNLRQQQLEFEELRNVELAEMQRLEDQQRRIKEEKCRRLAQQRMLLQTEKETAEKVAAIAFAHSYLQDLVPAAFSILDQDGYFYDVVERDIEQRFLPHLMGEVETKIEKCVIARTIVDIIIGEVVEKRMKEYSENDTK